MTTRYTTTECGACNASLSEAEVNTHWKTCTRHSARQELDNMLVTVKMALAQLAMNQSGDVRVEAAKEILGRLV